MVVVILCVFLLSYMYSEGKSNYFKGSILMLSYFTVMLGFYYSELALSAFDRSEYVVLGNGTRGNRMLAS
jgi:Ca2+:H+ antiporter